MTDSTLLSPGVRLPSHCFFVFQVIRRSGKWLYDSMSRSYLEFFKAVGLIGARGWPGAATNELHMFWHERFMIPTPPELIVLLFPFWPNLERAIKDLGAAASLSMHAAPLVLKYLARVVIQDAAGGVSRLHPDHDVHMLLKTSSTFRSVVPALPNPWLLITMCDSSARVYTLGYIHPMPVICPNIKCCLHMLTRYNCTNTCSAVFL